MEKISSLLDSAVLEIDRISMQVYFNNDVQDILLRSLDFHEKGLNYFDYNIQDSTKIRAILTSINFYKLPDRKIAVFNDTLSFISSGSYPEDALEFKNQIKNTNFIYDLLKSQNKILLLPPHKDWWSKSTSYPVISLIKEVFDTFNSGTKHLGYIEVQLLYKEIKEICTVNNNSNLKVLVINEKGDIIYPADSKYIKKEIYHYLNNTDENGVILKRPSDGIKELVYSKRSDYTNWIIVLAQPEADFMSPVYFLQKILVLFDLLFALVSLLIMYLITRSLTSPIREMRKLLKTLSLENLSIDLTNKTNNEILVFNDAFNKTLDRLRESMEQTIEARSSESQAHFLALQSQMNPHFIYNTLMVISSAGYELGSKKIVMICSQLSEMMRYIIASDTMQITLREELTHVENYLELLKWRFEDQLIYTLEIDERIYEIHVPKLIIQPLVENCYNHGFSGKRPPWNLKISGRYEDNTWEIEISDDGIGFSQIRLDDIKEQITDYKNRLKLGKAVRELSIGGMGLSNIYYRLYMLYLDDLIFEIYNNPDSGTTVKIGGPVEIKYSLEK